MKLYHGGIIPEVWDGSNLQSERLKFYADVKNFDEARQKVNQYVADHKIKSYYTRVTEIVDENTREQLGCWFDYGSHVHFFYLIFKE